MQIFPWINNAKKVKNENYCHWSCQKTCTCLANGNIKRMTVNIHICHFVHAGKHEYMNYYYYEININHPLYKLNINVYACIKH